MKSLVVIAVALGLFGCDKHGTSAVTFARGGGFASQPLTLEIDASGHATLDGATNGKRTRRTFTLTATQRTSLRKALDAARDAPAPKVVGGCADCFTYSIEADGLSVEYDDAAEVPATVQRLTQILTGLSG